MISCFLWGRYVVLFVMHSHEQGVSDASEKPGFFKAILDGSAEQVASAFAATERCFVELEVCCVCSGWQTMRLVCSTRAQATRRRLVDWVAIACVDDLASEVATLHRVTDWQRNYDALRVAARDADRLPAELVVGCFRVSLLALRADIEVACRRLQDALTTALHAKVGDLRLDVCWIVYKNGIFRPMRSVVRCSCF